MARLNAFPGIASATRLFSGTLCPYSRISQARETHDLSQQCDVVTHAGDHGGAQRCNIDINALKDLRDNIAARIRKVRYERRWTPIMNRKPAIDVVVI